MVLSLLEAKPQLTLLLADLHKRTDETESQSYEEDTVAASEQFNVEAVAKVLVTAEYEVSWSSTVQSSGVMVVTDGMIEDLIALWNNESPTVPDYIAIGTGTTTAAFDDDALATQAYRVAISTRTKAEDCGYCELGHGSFPNDLYRAIELEATFSPGASQITELGLFTGSSGNTCKTRVVFSALTNSTMDVKIRIRILPVAESTMLTLDGMSRMIEWFKNETGTYSKAIPRCSHMFHVGSPSFTIPTPRIADTTETSTQATVVPDASSAGTMTKTKYLNRNMLKLQFDYTYDYSGDKSSGADALEVGIAVAYDDTENAHWNFVMYRRRPEYISNKDGFSCCWILWIQFIRGDYGLSVAD